MPLRDVLRRLDPPRVTLECRVTPGPDLVEQVRTWATRVAGREMALDVRVSPRFPSGAALLLGRAHRIELDPGPRFLDRLDERLAAASAATLDEAASALSAALAEPTPPARLEAAAGRGRVLQVGDGVALVDGLPGVGSQEVVRFEGGVEGIAFSLFEDSVGCLLLGQESLVEEGGAVERTGRALHVPVGEALVGRVVDALGRPIDGGGPVAAERSRPIEVEAPGVVQRRPVSRSLHTGIKSLDALVPLGRGQRELVLGDRSIGKSTVALDVILSQRGTGVTCVYAAIGQKASSLARTVGLLRERGALGHTIVVAALAGDPPAYRYVAPYAACAIAEEFMRQGRDALVVFDDLSKHAVTYREISALLKRPIGREAYPGDVFYVHSRLLERAAQLRDDLGGGSLTAVPIVETLAGDIASLIPTNVISICDGQIVLDAGLFNEGFRPAMDVGFSVSRVGGMAQTPAMRRVAGRLRVDLAQYHEMARFVKFGAEVDEATLAQLARGERELEVLKQDPHAPLPLEEEIVILYAAVNGFLDQVPVDRVREFEAALQPWMEREHASVLAAIRDTGDLASAAEARLAAALGAFREEFLAAVPAATAG
jgi:F-type H+-transporting ATPase subunit alpha